MTVSTFYPSLDGITYRAGVNETWANIRAGAGNGSDAGDTPNMWFVSASSTTNQFSQNRRSIILFDTSSLTSGAIITSAVLSIYGEGVTMALGNYDLHVVAATPASVSALADSDYGQLGSTSFGSIARASINGAGYNDFTLNADGIANISKTGISQFGVKTSWDLTGTFGGSWGSGASSYVGARWSEDVTNVPKLVVTYTLPASFMVMF